MITFTYADNSESVDRTLAGFQDALAANLPALRQIADDFREMVAQQFASEGRAEGTPWPPRRSSRVGAQHAAPLLIRTGALRDSLVGPSAGHIEEMDERLLTLGTRVPYAIFHQLGTRHMPARPIIVLTEARGAKWTEIVRHAMEQKAQVLGTRELGG